MDFIFADDARQLKPTRNGMGPLVAIGGVHVPDHAIGRLEREIEELCRITGFPEGEQFKWSPGKNEQFMKSVLIDEKRAAFYQTLFSIASNGKARAFVVIEDEHKARATPGAASPEQDVTAMFLERAKWSLGAKAEAVVVIAAPSGGKQGEARFLAECLATIREGTPYTGFEQLPLGVLLAKSRHIRLLQLADVITSCTLARFAGEKVHCPPIFDILKPLLRHDGGRIGGVGVKLHPDGRYANLYHWILGDDVLWKGNMGFPLPLGGRAYASGPDAA